MRGRLMRRGAVLVAALAVGVAGAVGAVAPPVASAEEVAPLTTPGMAVPLERAGELRLWGDNTYDQATVPASLRGVAISQVVFPDAAALALTADGRVVGWGSNADRLQQVPDEVASAKVAQIATGPYGGAYAGAVTRDGRVLTWGAKRAFATPLNVPAGLRGVKQLAIADFAAAALKDDGSVVAWGMPDYGRTAVPEGLKATAITAQDHQFFALTEQGTVVTWGYPVTGGLPAMVQIPGNVKAIASTTTGTLALLADDTLVAFGTTAGALPPAEFLAGDPLLLANGGVGEFAYVDASRAVRYWNRGDRTGTRPPGEVPAELDGQDLAQIVLGSFKSSSIGYPNSLVGGVIVTKMLRAAAPKITGTARVGSRLTATPGTFSGAPDDVAGQWLANGAPIAGATGTSLVLTSAMVGKRISYESTATKAGEETVSSTSTAAKVSPAGKVASKTKVVKVAVAKKAAKVSVTGKVTASKSVAGKAKVTIKKGKKAIVAKSVKVNAKGAVKLTVKKFANLVAKKLRAKGKKAKTAYRGKYTVTIAYAGNAQVKPSKATKNFTIRR
ncbi:hypothetical protein FXB39_01605 [Nocardioides sp. BGMRC 2183]|nr:hypothetical protein FXB39_01605 [Nocardioides sp. BGMRC 2183]